LPTAPAELELVQRNCTKASSSPDRSRKINHMPVPIVSGLAISTALSNSKAEAHCGLPMACRPMIKTF
jgi:hypothetical protein